jgi:3-deoxy-7-phosphoheptulonate synthase
MVSTRTSAQHGTPLVDRSTRPGGSVVEVGAVRFGDSGVVVIAGPCSVESRMQLFETAAAVRRGGAVMLRGGAYKPRTSPYAFQGLKEEGLRLLAEAGREFGMPVVTEVMDTSQVAVAEPFVDMYQIGSRSMHQTPLLEAVGRSGKPVLLKRGMSATVDEWLLAAEYVLQHGNENVVLCERGIRTFETATRNTLDLSAVPVVRRRTHLPVIIDPSHGTGDWRLVPVMSGGAVAVGADGLLIEVHHDPDRALCDGSQSLRPQVFGELMARVGAVAAAVGRGVACLESAERSAEPIAAR